MIKLKRLAINKIDPGINKKGQIEFTFTDCYVRKSLIGGVVIISNEERITDGWCDKETKKYAKENNLNLCTIYITHDMPYYANIIIDNAVEKLINDLD